MAVPAASPSPTIHASPSKPAREEARPVSSDREGQDAWIGPVDRLRRRRRDGRRGRCTSPAGRPGEHGRSRGRGRRRCRTQTPDRHRVVESTARVEGVSSSPRRMASTARSEPPATAAAASCMPTNGGLSAWPMPASANPYGSTENRLTASMYARVWLRRRSLWGPAPARARVRLRRRGAGRCPGRSAAA